MEDFLINIHVILCPAQVQKVICVNVLHHVFQHFLPEKDVPLVLCQFRHQFDCE